MLITCLTTTTIMNTNKITITAMILSVLSVGMIGSQSVEATLDFELEPYVEDHGFAMGFAYKCGAEYNYAGGLTIISIAQTAQGDYVSILTYYDEYNVELNDYEVVQEIQGFGNAEVMQSLVQYWEDRTLSSVC
jgi:hypothetical protein